MPPRRKSSLRPRQGRLSANQRMPIGDAGIEHNCWRRSSNPYGTNRRTTAATAVRNPGRRAPGLLRAAVREAIAHHCAHCPPFDRWYRKQGATPKRKSTDLTRVPFLPVSIFKRLRSNPIGEKDVVRVLRSSATSSQTPSRMVLDRVTRDRQMRTLAVIQRPDGILAPALRGVWMRPLHAGQIVELSARVAGMRGYLMMASETQYVLELRGGRLELDAEKLADFRRIGRARQDQCA